MLPDLRLWSITCRPDAAHALRDRFSIRGALEPEAARRAKFKARNGDAGYAAVTTRASSCSNRLISAAGFGRLKR
jgi:DNA-binding GntR family transcriptional regulator